MASTGETLACLAGIPNLSVSADVPLSRYTRFGIGGPADIYVETASEDAFLSALALARSSGLPYMVMGGGTNLVVSDAGFRGIMLRLVADRVSAAGNTVTADAGAVLQDLVDFTVARGLGGLETLAGIPGSVGAAVYGNAGAYGHSISECVRQVRFFDGATVQIFAREACEFAYRESAFKRHKEWVVFTVDLNLETAAEHQLRATSDEILAVRNRKFPVTMKCAGSIFKNLILNELPAATAARVPDGVVREGKVAAAWFLEQVGAKRLRVGDMVVADYHANLIYNAGGGTAEDLCALIGDLKGRVREEFGFVPEEEVQYVGFVSGAPRGGAYTSV